MSIREMKVDDLKRIVELEKDLFLSPWNEVDFIHELKENPMAGYYILEKENQIIGYIGLWFLGDQCQITTIATDRHFQGQGYASQLMEYALEKSEELHYQNVNLEVRVSNVKAIALYQKYGWDKLPICMAKTQNSLSDDAKLVGRPVDFTIHVRNINISRGAGFIVAYTGNVLTMPGLPKVPAAINMGIDENGETYGLF